MPDDKLAKTEQPSTALIKRAEKEVLGKSLSMLSDATRFADVPPESKITENPPEWWMKEYETEMEAVRAWRVAHYALLPTKDSPVGLKLASNVAIGIIQAQAARAANRPINVMPVHMSVPISIEGELKKAPVVESEYKQPRFESVVIDTQGTEKGRGPGATKR